MGAHHSHAVDKEAAGRFVANRRVVTILVAVLVPILLATLAAGAVLWPTGRSSAQRVATAVPGEQVVQATVRSSSATTCKGESSDRLPDGSIPATVTCAFVVARLPGGRDVKVAVPTPVYRSGIAPGDRIELSRYPAADGAPVAYAWLDFARAIPLGLLALVFSLLVVGVARLRGLAAILGLGLAYITVVKFMLPALLQGENAVAVAVTGSIAVMTVVLYLAHGVSAKTTTALLGTIFGLLLSGGLAAWASAAAHLNGLSSDQSFALSQLTGGLDLSGIIVCGIIVAGLGVLNDVTITQASAVWEVHAYAPHLGLRALFSSGMRVGRDHLASTVYTIAFAYAGAALPTLILIDLYQRPLAQVLTSGDIATEIVRTLVGSIGLILAIPLTTVIAALVVTSARPAGRTRPADSIPPDSAPIDSAPIDSAPLAPAPMTRRARRGR